MVRLVAAFALLLIPTTAISATVVILSGSEVRSYGNFAPVAQPLAAFPDFGVVTGFGNGNESETIYDLSVNELQFRVNHIRGPDLGDVAASYVSIRFIVGKVEDYVLEGFYSVTDELGSASFSASLIREDQSGTLFDHSEDALRTPNPSFILGEGSFPEVRGSRVGRLLPGIVYRLNMRYVAQSSFSNIGTGFGRLRLIFAPEPDADNDDVPDASDRCPLTFDPDQRDSDGDGSGDACQPGDFDGNGILDLVDSVLIRRVLAGEAVP